VQLTVIATVGGILVGTFLALMRLSGKPALAYPATIYVNTMRSIPLVMVILWFFLLIPMLIGRPIGADLSATITFIAFEGAFFSEIVRAGIPVFMTQTIILFQDTSLVYAIGAYDLLKGFEIAGKNYGRPIETYILAAFTYFIICFSLSKIVRKVQSKVAIIR
jgi:glutamate/aspartate transport system permease protein